MSCIFSEVADDHYRKINLSFVQLKPSVLLIVLHFLSLATIILVVSMRNQRSTNFVSAVYAYYPDATKLGRIVLNPQDLVETYYDLYPAQDVLKSSGEIHITSGIDLASTYNSSKKKSLRGALLQLFSGFLSSSTEGEASLEGETKRYQLGNAETHFRKACASEEAREWLQENVVKPKVDAYMIVGYHTITNLKIVTGNQRETETRFRADDAFATSAGAPGHPGVANMRSATFNQHRFKHKISADGEVIFAVQFRKLLYKIERLFSPAKEVGLKESQWIMFLDVRGQDEEKNYLVETDLGEIAEYEPEPADSDDEDEVAMEPPESYYVETGVCGEDGEAIQEEFVFFNDIPPEEDDEEDN